MDKMERRAFMKGAGKRRARLHGGRRRSPAHAERGAGAGRAVSDVHRRRRRRRSRRWARRSCRARARPALRISSISRSQCRRRRRCSRRAFSTCVRLTRISTARRSARSTAPARRSTAARFAAAWRRASSASFVDNMRQNKIEGWQGPAGAFVYTAAAQRCRRCRLRHHGRLCRPRHSLHAPHRADEEVVTWRTKKSMSSSSAPARRARCMPRCWPRPARRSWCWSRDRTGSCPI